MSTRPRFTVKLEPSLNAPSEARAAIRAELGTALTVDAEIVVSELVANAVEHARGPVDVQVVVLPTAIRIEVSSTSGTTVPEVVHPAPSEPTGRGLLIVDGLTDAWGHHHRGGRRTVWAELTRADSRHEPECS